MLTEIHQGVWVKLDRITAVTIEPIQNSDTEVRRINVFIDDANSMLSFRADPNKVMAIINGKTEG
jgi:hypothetical protein